MTTITVDQDARWAEIQAKSQEIAYRDEPPSPLESMLCGAVVRAQELERQNTELREALKAVSEELNGTARIRSKALDRAYGIAIAALAEPHR